MNENHIENLTYLFGPQSNRKYIQPNADYVSRLAVLTVDIWSEWTTYLPLPVLFIKLSKLYEVHDTQGYEALTANILTHWGLVTYICISKLIIIGSDNGLLPGRHQVII